MYSDVDKRIERVKANDFYRFCAMGYKENGYDGPNLYEEIIDYMNLPYYDEGGAEVAKHCIWQELPEVGLCEKIAHPVNNVNFPAKNVNAAGRAKRSGMAARRTENAWPSPL